MGVYEAYDHGTVTVSTVAKGMADVTWAGTGLARSPGSQGPDQALITVVGGAIRFWSDGGVPTTSAGNVAPDGSSIVLGSPGDVANFKAIRDDAADAVLSIQLYRFTGGER
jgi:hypothetical protein